MHDMAAGARMLGLGVGAIAPPPISAAIGA